MLEAAAVASKLHMTYPLGNRTSFDIMSVVQDLQIPVLFRPLKGLLGAALTVGTETRGILITTNRDAQVQRFTLAHELGHVLFDHNQSFDGEEDVGFAGRSQTINKPIEEFLVDSFASELLCGKGLIRRCSIRQGWTLAALSSPSVVYQLSLRLGISYQAACWGLAYQSIITPHKAAELAARRLLDLKHQVAPRVYLTNSWANAWSLSVRDHGTQVEAGPDDVFVLNLNENSSAGYLWELQEPDSNIEILSEKNIDVSDLYGAPSPRSVLFRFPCAGAHRLTFIHQRPWSGDQIGHVDINVDNVGKEQPGWPRRIREAALASA
jgi:Zn-dependent peptidase ImmA (M78 family)/predicted secreted protein